MEQKIKAIAAFLKVEEAKLTNKVMSNKLKEMELDGTGNKETLVNRIFDALKLKVEEVKEEKKEPIKPNAGMKKTAGFYAKYMASRNNVQGQETPIFNFNDMRYVRTIVLPHSAAKSLNIQKLNSGIVYKEVESKESK